MKIKRRGHDKSVVDLLGVRRVQETTATFRDGLVSERRLSGKEEVSQGNGDSPERNYPREKQLNNTTVKSGGLHVIDTA